MSSRSELANAQRLAMAQIAMQREGRLSAQVRARQTANRVVAALAVLAALIALWDLVVLLRAGPG